MAPVGYIQSDLDLKLLVLYIMDRVAGPFSFLQLLDLALLCDSGVNYFPLTQAVSHLVETEHLSLDGEHYSITEKGRRNSQICQDSLPYSVRRRCDEFLVGINAQLRRDAQIRGELLPREDGTFTVHLAVGDQACTLMDLQLLVPTQEQAKQLIAHFRKQPEQFYSQLSELLLGPSEQNK